MPSPITEVENSRGRIPSIYDEWYPKLKYKRFRHSLCCSWHTILDPRFSGNREVKFQTMSKEEVDEAVVAKSLDVDTPPRKEGIGARIIQVRGNILVM